MERKYLISIIIVLVVVGVGIIALTGGFEFSTASLGNFATAEEVDDDYRPVEVVDEFSPDTEVIYATCEVSNAPSETEIKTEWYYLDDNERFNTLKHTVDGGSGPLSFSYEPEDGLWPVGDYEVRFFLDGQQVGVVEFSVEVEEEASISDVAMAEEIDNKGKPVEVVDEFSPETEIFYATFEISNALPSNEIETELYFVDNDQLVLSEPIPLDGFYTGPAHVSYTKPHDGWPTGNYEVRVFLDGERVGTAAFSIKEDRISLDPESDLITTADLPSEFVEDTEAGWKEEQSEFEGVPFDSAAFRFWEQSSEDRFVSSTGFVCPSVDDAQEMLDESHSYWTDHFGSYDDTTVETVDFSNYGDELTASEAVNVENGTTYAYIVTLRVQNVTVTVVTGNISKSETEDYCSLVESRIVVKQS
ncbi:hypothetical protein AKJ37_06325 [candidate division MSBL1 archaeon SCGC-AAA259I09]|uniref:Ig-like domain-containing protein n=3 Tax=candidate division MSBL1 TaxID=215777 RepID=A0A133UPB6_9EURY|nr:hypothetical protein AKJ37_06325 [candidate division MSBL1 archaeon SCGC-AAA259I09]KXA96995.1 hypothetical protein AKJ39_03840 [candidate division MSBL1 archaeon SCGC-AAA259J03]KXA99521.1 hypothetical protein AKJ40_02960 [candidate division MSBL1 archaeon SCGC-AAA259M10]